MHNYKLPHKINVKEVVSSRYLAGKRPISWDERKEGIETVVTEDNQEVNLYSNGGQSSPAPGWQLLLTKEVSFAGTEAIAWTLYGIAKN